MNISELKANLNTFMNLENLSLTVYLRLKTGDIKLADINDDILPELRGVFFEKIKFNIIEKENLCLLNLSEADERKNVIYEYDFNEELSLFTEINDIENNLLDNDNDDDNNNDKFNFRENTINDIDGLVIRIANSSTSIILYSKCYPINMVKQDKVLKLIPAGTRFDKFNEQILKISGNFEIIKHGSEYFILKYELLERNYGLENIIRSTASSSLERIDDLGLVQNIAPLQENLESLSFARKFAKASKYSPVINRGLTTATIINFVKNHSNLADKFKFDNDGNKFVLDSKASCKLFVKLLDDDYVRSLLTGINYDTVVKDQMAQ